MCVFKKCLAIFLISCFVIVLVAILFCFAVFLSGRMTIRCSSPQKLSNLMGVDFGNKIVDVFSQYNAESDSTKICVIIDETRPLTECEYYRNVYEKNFIPHGHIEDLEKMGIRVEDIEQCGMIYKEIVAGDFISPYSIHWHQIHNTACPNGNIVFITWIPRKISVDVEKILACK